MYKQSDCQVCKRKIPQTEKIPQIVAPNGTTFPIIKSEKLYLLRAKLLEFCSTSEGNTNSFLWHQRLGHNNMGDVERPSSCVLRMTFKGSSFEKPCVCVVFVKIPSSTNFLYPTIRSLESLKNLSKFCLIFWGRCPQLSWAVNVLLFFC